ncbi:uncharacterized protein LOC128919738 isoform X2 [Zeugodacus cucurbitae]|uniref:uncharacterized protein LOC128919738 isoform X2 n=1 Tax=Zeugodacus cucurbitae TaxID=28588 RepID=UPI0023D8F958|nr:uncharacterized protein LOC128919738 isoform X2 [Zeugodacus cucurbitae]
MKFTILLLTFCLLQIFQVQARYVDHDRPLLFPIQDRYEDHDDNPLTYDYIKVDTTTEEDTVSDEQKKSILWVIRNGHRKNNDEIKNDGIPLLVESKD